MNNRGSLQNLITQKRGEKMKKMLLIFCLILSGCASTGISRHCPVALQFNMPIIVQGDFNRYYPERVTSYYCYPTVCYHYGRKGHR